jgi:ubiquinone/menaquinone biosynthesis C-methylase UbiE
MEPESDVQTQRDLMYGEADLSSLSIFSGSFINYGYWGELDPDREITIEERTESQAEMYSQVVSRLRPGVGDFLLEVGCGLGVGAAQTVNEYTVIVSGMDRSEAQLERALAINASDINAFSGALSYVQGAVTAIPYQDGSVDGVYAVEMLQHVDDLAQAAREIHRVLRPGGRFATATFFARDDAPADAPVADLIETVASGVDVIRPVGAFAADLTAAGFEEVTVESIGEHVWRQFDRWVAQTEFHDSWGRNWLRCYENGWVDYYLLSARKPG